MAVVAYDERAVIIARSEINDLCWVFLYSQTLPMDSSWAASCSPAGA